ncbi:hypothetical protein HMPREF0762_00756 [Slackia exigua ATCC 700122]|uniref:Uncharacterized protein n=1 Tax=Slackia exigua (strain ATCC 700122 / DSM 15923 / CIP 105133 / JCM 11022 / KCTC 5966 / S-7) TaxID=649764 RepID=D0WG06_SLAES|nr:hypothetical protein HMPREF0762_00756 [Slackia exigua ATCC 700122]
MFQTFSLRHEDDRASTGRFARERADAASAQAATPRRADPLRRARGCGVSPGGHASRRPCAVVR